MKKTLALLMLLAGLSVEAQAVTLTWNGGSMEWNTTDDNWLQDETAAKYTDGNDVVFGNTGSGTVTLSGTFTPASVTVKSLENYIFDGTGKLTGEMTLNMEGIGSTLTINTCNDYKGGTLISYGTLALGNDYALGSGTVTMSNICKLDLGGHILTNSVTTEQDWEGGIGNGTLDGNLFLGQGSSTTLIGDLSGKGNILMGDNSSLNLGGHKLSNSVIVQGNASISNGTIDNNLTVEMGKTLTLLSDNLKGSGTIYLGKSSTLDLNGKTLDRNVSLESATITAGRLNGYIVVSSPVTGAELRLGGDLSGSDTIYIINARLNLGGYTLSKNVKVLGKSFIDFGTLDASLYVEAGAMLRLSTCGLGQGTITLGNNAELQLGGSPDFPGFTLYNKVILEGSASIGCGTINGSISVGANNKLTLLGNTTITEAIKLGDHATLDLGGSALTCDVSLGLNTVIGNGTLNGSLDVAANDSMQLCGDLAGTGAINLGDNATLRLGGFKLDKAVTLAGKATIGDGTLNVDLTVAAGKSLTLLANTSVTGGISLADGAALDLGCNSVTGAVSLSGSATIGNGTIGGNVAVDDGKSVRFFGETYINSDNTLGEGLVSYHGKIEAGGTTIQALPRPLESQIGAPVYPGLMKELTVSKGLIAGTDRQASLADGLKIQSDADLMIESMTITANNEIYVGDNTITLKDVTIKLSEDYFDRQNPVGGVYYFKLQDLFHCNVEFNNVVFDASALELPTGFDPGVNGIGMDFGDDVTIDPQTAKNLTLLMDGDWSRTMNLVDGKPVFTKLVETPEPTTGTLSLLALAALAARRRK